MQSSTTDQLIKASRIAYAIALLAYAVQQFFYKDFRPVFLPAWQQSLPALKIWAYAFGLWLFVAAFAIIMSKYARTISLLLGAIFLALYLFVHIPYELVADPYSTHLGSWAFGLKELALAGGAFVIAGTYKESHSSNGLIKFLSKIIPAGRIFFSITMIVFGITHFVYVDFVASLVPGWIPFHVFWTYLAGAALIAAGLAIIIKLSTREVATALSITIFIWLLILHIPRAISDPVSNRGNELASAFDALAFSGIAFLIAHRNRQV